MPGRFIFLPCAIAFALSSSPALAETPPLQPSSQWNVDFGKTNCRLARFFGEGEGRHVLFMQQYQPGSTFGLTVAGPGLKRFQSLRRTSLQFYTAQDANQTEPFKGDVNGFGDALIYSAISIENGDDLEEEEAAGRAALPQLDAALGGKVGFVYLRQGSRKVRFETGPLGEAFKVMNQCTQDMIRDWGLDVDKHLSAQSLPQWTNQSSVTHRIQATYPNSALNKGEQGIFRLRVIVDEAGKVTDCIINNATTQDRLESPACREMQKATFNPALDADGRPFRSYYSTSIVYRVG